MVDEATAELRRRQKQWVDNLHGDKPIESNNLFLKLISKDSTLQSKTVDNYLEQWDGKTDNETENRRLNSYNENTFSYYNLVTDFYEYGWGQSFHFCKFFINYKTLFVIKIYDIFTNITLVVNYFKLPLFKSKNMENFISMNNSPFTIINGTFYYGVVMSTFDIFNWLIGIHGSTFVFLKQITELMNTYFEGDCYEN